MMMRSLLKKRKQPSETTSLLVKFLIKMNLSLLFELGTSRGLLPAQQVSLLNNSFQSIKNTHALLKTNSSNILLDKILRLRQPLERFDVPKQALRIQTVLLPPYSSWVLPALEKQNWPKPLQKNFSWM